MEKVIVYAGFALLTLGLCGIPSRIGKTVRPTKNESSEPRFPSNISPDNISELVIYEAKDDFTGKPVVVTDGATINSFIKLVNRSYFVPEKSGTPSCRVEILYTNGVTVQLYFQPTGFELEGERFISPKGLFELVQSLRKQPR
jgi:hypothetical protein